MQISASLRGALIKLYKKADEWLMLKDSSASSRYYQVTTLRDNIHHELIHQFNSDSQRLYEINYQNMHKHHYFQTH